MNKYYPGEPVNIHIQSLINIIQENNWVITKKKGKGKLPLFRGNVEQVIPIYGSNHKFHTDLTPHTMATSPTTDSSKRRALFIINRCTEETIRTITPPGLHIPSIIMPDMETCMYQYVRD